MRGLERRRGVGARTPAVIPARTVQDSFRRYADVRLAIVGTRFVWRTLRLVVFACVATAASGAWGPAGGQPSADSSASTFAAPRWAYPVRPAGPATSPTPRPDSTQRFHVPHSRQAYTAARLGAAAFDVADWFPAAHPVMPPVVAHGRAPLVTACGFCHLPDGRGRPENATLTGLPAAYIVAQMADMASGARRPALEGVSPPFDAMRAIAAHATPEDVAVAARYFAALRLARPRARVVESDSLPTLRELTGLYAVDGPPDTRLGRRLLEATTDVARHERHDPGVQYVTYVPRGSLARGRALAAVGAAGTADAASPTACARCHGADLRGVGAVPAIAGRAPSYLLRQLFAFKAGTRASPTAAPMRAVVAALSVDDMIAAAAYAGSVTP